MKLSSTMNRKGQVTVPRDICRRIGLKPGDRVEFIFEVDRITISPVRQPKNPFAKYLGALSTFRPVGEINAWLRALRQE